MTKKKHKNNEKEKKIEDREKNKSNSFYFWEGDTLVLNVLGTPSAKKDAILKVKGNQLKISVTESPDRGKATDHMVRFLAKTFGISPKNITVVFGQMNVNKQLRIKSPKNLPEIFVKPDQT